MRIHNHINTQGFRRSQIATTICALTLSAGVIATATDSHAGSTGSATTTNGQPLHIEILSPTDGSSVSAGGMLDVEGKVSLGSPISSTTSIVFVVDVSASTTFPSIVNDCNNDGVVNGWDDFAPTDRASYSDPLANVIGSTLDCEAAGVMSLNYSLGANTDVHVGMVVFATQAEPAISFTSPPNLDADNNGIADIDDYLIDIHEGIEGVSYATNFSDALDAMVSMFNTRPATDNRIAYFLTDGIAQSLNLASVTAASNAGITVHTYAIGTQAEDCVPSAKIQMIADGTDGTCTEVEDPSTLSTLLSNQGNSAPPGISDVTVSINGGTPISTAVDAIGDFTLSQPAALLSSGSNLIAAEVIAEDYTVATADVLVTMTGSAAQCNGKAITVDIASGQVPTSGDDVILGTSGADSIYSQGGNDTICAMGGNDVIDSGSGDDWIDAGPGRDKVKGAGGADQIYGGAGPDKIQGQGGDDYIVGGKGRDRLEGGAGNDQLTGGMGTTCIGGSGTNIINCGFGL